GAVRPAPEGRSRGRSHPAAAGDPRRVPAPGRRRRSGVRAAFRTEQLVRRTDPDPMLDWDSSLDWDLTPERRWNPRVVLLVIAGLVTVLAAAMIVLQLRRGEPSPAAPARAAPAITLAEPSGHEGAAGYPVGFPRT